MRNAATFDEDLGYEMMPRKAARRPATGKSASGKGAAGKSRPGAPGKRTKRSRGFSFDMHRVARFAAIGMAATIATAIMVNALVLQKGRHPAPLFGKALTPIAAAVTPKVAAAPAHADMTAEVPQPPRRAALASSEADVSDKGDMIGKLLAGSPGPASGKAKLDKSKGDKAKGDKARLETAADAKTDEKTVSAAQKALTKLGFKVPATGAVGPATKKAIEAFEKDRHLPVKGDLNRRLVKVLAAESGIRID